MGVRADRTFSAESAKRLGHCVASTAPGLNLRHVIFAHLSQDLRPQQVCAAVADIEDYAAIAPDRRADERGTHCGPAYPGAHRLKDGPVRFV
jgi:hypothetical protein